MSSVSTSGNSNAPGGRDRWPYCYSAVVAGCDLARGAQQGESDQTGSSPKDKPMHPNDLLATTYYALGIDPDMIVLNHLNQPEIGERQGGGVVELMGPAEEKRAGLYSTSLMHGILPSGESLVFSRPSLAYREGRCGPVECGLWDRIQPNEILEPLKGLQGK